MGSMRIFICRISLGWPRSLHPMSIDTLGFEPRAFRMRGGSDTTMPRAPGKITSLQCTGRQQQERRRGCGPSRRRVVRQSCKMTKMLLAVLEKGLCDRNSPICTLSQNGYGDLRVKARKCSCFLPLDKITALHVHGASRRSGYWASRRTAGHQ